MVGCTCHPTSWPIKDARQVITFVSKCGTIKCRCIKDFDWSYQSTNQRIVFFPSTGSSFGVKNLTHVHTVVHNKKSSSVLAYQDGRVVKALDLSSNGGIPAWVRTSLLVNFFYFSISPAAHQWFQPIRDQNRDREGKNAQYELNSNFKERLAKIMKTWHRFKKMGRLKIGLGLGHKMIFSEISTR